VSDLQTAMKTAFIKSNRTVGILTSPTTGAANEEGK
jgi:hypothetical protein